MMTMVLQCDEDLISLADEYCRVVQEEKDEWTITSIGPLSSSQEEGNTLI